MGEGLKAGRFQFFPSVAFEFTSDSNIFYTSRELPDDQIVASDLVSVRPRLLMDLPMGVNRVRWVYSPVYRNYLTNGFEQGQRVSHFLDFEAAHMGPVLTLRAFNHFVLGTIELREVDRGGEAVFGLTPFRSNTSQAEVSLGIGARSGISLLPLYTTVTFDNSDSASFFAYRRQQVELRFNHAVTSTSGLYAFYAREGTQQDRSQVVYEDVSYDGRTAGIGVQRTLNREVQAFFNVGYKAIDFTGGARSNFRGPTLDASATWQVGEGTVLAVAAAHQLYQSFYVNNNYYVDSELKIQAKRQLGRSLFGQLSIGFMNNVYSDEIDISATAATPPELDCNPKVPDPGNPGTLVCGGDGRIDTYEALQPSVGRRRRDRLFSVEIGAGWQIDRALRLFIGYNSERRRSNIEEVVFGETVDPFDYGVNRLVFRIEAGWL